MRELRSIGVTSFRFGEFEATIQPPPLVLDEPETETAEQAAEKRLATLLGSVAR